MNPQPPAARQERDPKRFPPSPGGAPSSVVDTRAPWRRKLHDVIFESDTTAGKAFDLALILLILCSVVVVSMETVQPIANRAAWQGGPSWGRIFRSCEWIFTLLFTAEYVLRLVCVQRPSAYAKSFFGLVDLLSILPTYLAVLIPSIQSLLVVRILRLLRVFRVLKLAHMVRESSHLRLAVWHSRGKIIVFVMTVLSMVAILGALMYLIESSGNPGFSSIPQSMYWAIVTMTTVGYGDVAPVTPIGKLVSAAIMVLGYSMIIVPTGILSAELAAGPRPVSGQVCSVCMREGQPPGANYCFHCGADL